MTEMWRAIMKFFSPSVWVEQENEIVSDLTVDIENVPEPIPQLRRVYSAKLSRGIQVKVTIRQFSGSVLRRGELNQPDGRWVLFEPERVADKIIDQVLLPEVVMAVDQILAEDKKWRSSRIAEFRNERGETWRLVT